MAEASWVKVQRWKEKAEGESHRPSLLFGLFSFVLNPILLVLAQGCRRRSPGQLRPPLKCRQCLRPRSGSTTYCRAPPVPPARP